MLAIYIIFIYSYRTYITLHRS